METILTVGYSSESGSKAHPGPGGLLLLFATFMVWFVVMLECCRGGMQLGPPPMTALPRSRTASGQTATNYNRSNSKLSGVSNRSSTLDEVMPATAYKVSKPADGDVKDSVAMLARMAATSKKPKAVSFNRDQ